MSEEMTNQSIDDDSFEIEEANESYEEVEEQAESSDTTTETVDDFELDIRYNGQNQKLTREEATTLAQKGMNYDKIYNQLQSALNNPALKVIESNAKKAGLSVDDYVNRMAQFQDTMSINQIASNFKKENPDVSDAVANQYAREVFKNQQAEQARKDADKAKADADAENNRLYAEVQAFNQRFPDVDIEHLPNEVVDDINAGIPLMEAYLIYENQQLRNRVVNSETNARNKANSVGKVSANVDSDAVDPFVQGLLG